MTSPKDLPARATAQYEALSDNQKLGFTAEFHRRRRSLWVMLLLALFFPIQLFFLGRIGLGVLFILTGGGFGIWYVIEWFLTPGRVRRYNEGLAFEILGRLDAA
ncbi:MAG: TM2 domain-containing protein [Acidimicrobiia bacterium]